MTPGARPHRFPRILLGGVVVLSIAAALATPPSRGAEGSAAPPHHASDPPTPLGELNHGRMLLYRIGAPSLGESERSVRVYLPRGYDDSAAAAKRFPVVYLLHGWPGGDGNWPGQGRAVSTLDSLVEDGRIPKVIAVMPNGEGIGLWGRSLYLNTFDGRSRMEDFIAHDLVAWVDRSFRTRPDSTHRAIIGLSEGATAALNLAFKHPDVFGACGGHSGQYVIARDVGMGAVFGPEPGATALREANSPTLYADRIAARLRHLVIYFDCGTHDGEVEDNRALNRKLEELGVPHTYREFPGHHGWTYWRTHLRDSLVACLSGMK